MFVDSHCHIHESQFFSENRDEVYERARSNDVSMLCIGTSESHSREALKYADSHDEAWATVGVHPHDTKDGWSQIKTMIDECSPSLVGVGEIGLDYFYDNSPRDVQLRALEEQLQWASDANLPVSFHVREAFDDFWPVFNNFPGLRGVLHSYTDSIKNLEKALENSLFIGVNGISTFARDKAEMWDAVPLERMLLETDAPFLTPSPHRGKVNEPAFVKHVAEYHANRRAVELEHLARVTSANATTLFGLS